MDITLTVTPADLETIVACLNNRARVIGGATKSDRVEQERLYRIAAELNIQAIRNTNPATAETSGKWIRN